MEDDRDLEFAALYDQIDQIPPEYKNLSSEEIAERCNNAIAALYKNRKEKCEIAFGGRIVKLSATILNDIPQMVFCNQDTFVDVY